MREPTSWACGAIQRAKPLSVPDMTSATTSASETSVKRKAGQWRSRPRATPELRQTCPPARSTESMDCSPRHGTAPGICSTASVLPPDLRISYFALYATTSPAVIWGGFGYNEARLFCRTQSAAFLLDSCAA